LPGRGAPARRADKKHDELKSFGRFWYQEIRDFLNSKRTVPKSPGAPWFVVPFSRRASNYKLYN